MPVTIRAKRNVILSLSRDGNSSSQTIVKDRVYAPDDPYVRAFPDEFIASKDVPIEQTTAAPGERRNVSR